MSVVENDSVVSVNYTGTFSDSGEVFDTNIGGEPLVLLVGHGNKIEGLEQERILKNSAVIRSHDTILIRAAWWFIDSLILESTRISNLAQKYAALIILKGSSEKVLFGSRGVTSCFACKSRMPLKGSDRSPKRFGCRSIAMALIVKSLRSRSPFKSAYRILLGFREDSS